jgi:DNA-binding IclR family transcriptional regulator
LAQRKASSSRVPFGQWPLAVPSHDVWAPNETVKLSPFARVRERGEMGTMAKSAVRALDIVELLARTGRPMRAIEIAGALGLSPSSTHQLLKTMMDSAYLIFDPFSKCYHASIRTANAGGALANAWFGPGAIEGLIDAIHAALDTAVTVSACQGSFMQILDVFEPGPARHGGREMRQESIGLRVPIFGSCTGAAWLAAQTDETVLATARLCRRALDGQADDTAHIIELVHRIREQGHAYGGLSADDGSRAIALPLPPSRDGQTLVISISGPAEEIRQQREAIAASLKGHIAARLRPRD